MITWPENAGSFEANIYDNPEKFNLKIVEETERPNLGYEFDILLLLQDLDSGEKWFVADAGCSCPHPFDGVNSQGHLTPFRGHEAEYIKLRYNMLHNIYTERE